MGHTSRKPSNPPSNPPEYDRAYTEKKIKPASYKITIKPYKTI